MKIRPLWMVLLCWSLVFVFACITINIYFPEAAVKEIADEIVGEVRKSEEKKDEVKKVSVEKEIKLVMAHSFSLVPAAYAQGQETTVSNATIRALKESIKARFAELERFYDAGNVGEANDGFVQVREEGDLSLKDRAQLRQLVKDENDDREKLYAEVARALDIESSQVSRVGKVFAGSWINQARAGWWIQKEDGAWVKKTSF